MLTPTILTRRSYHKSSTSLPAEIRNRKSKGTRRGRHSILRNRAAQDSNRSSLFATRRRKRCGESQRVRFVLSERNFANDYPTAFEPDRDRQQVRHPGECSGRRAGGWVVGNRQ